MISIYGPNEDNPQFYKDLEEQMKKLPIDNIVIGGDFNFVVNRKEDSNYFHDNNCNAREQFLNTMEKYEMVDLWRHLHPSERQYTWLKRNPIKFGRLDMFFISDHLLSHTSECRILSGYRTDHSIVSFSLKDSDDERGSYLWKFNESLLNDNDYIQVITDSVTEVVSQYAIPVYSTSFLTDPSKYEQVQFTIDVGLFYETLLMMLRGATIKYSKRKARKYREKEEELIKTINSLRERMPEEMSDQNLDQLEMLERKLEELRAPKIQGFIIRSRVSWHDEGERCTKYFLSLEKRNNLRKSISSIKVEDKTIHRKKDILHEFTSHYKAKYSVTCELPDPTSYLKQNIKRKLSTKQRELLDTPLTLHELTVVLASMKKGKSPGTNGFTAAFFKKFWPQLGAFLLRVVNLNIIEGHLTNSFREGVMTLIPKPGKPTDTIKGWRPITLLNTDYKIVSAVIASRLKSVMSDLISPVQSAYLKGRYIGENTRLVYDLIDSLNRNRESGIILAADFEAAFETVSWPFLLKTLDEYNFGPYFKHLVQLFYLNESNFSRIMLDGFLGEKIYLHQGIRQGDPSSGYLFNLVVEPLANHILHTDKLQGIQIKNQKEIRVSQYADDLIMFLRPDTNSLLGALHEIRAFSRVSGLCINENKTKCISVGQCEQVDINFMNALGITFVDEIKILGIIFNNDNSDITDRNIEKKLQLLTKETAQWDRRHLSLFGKVTVIKSSLLSKLVHIFIALPDPSLMMIRKIEKLFYNFLWKGNDRVKRAKMVQSYKSDGLGMVDLVSFIKSMKTGWIRRLYWSKQDWALLTEAALSPIDVLVTYGGDKLGKVTKTVKNPFWRDVMKAWTEFIKLRRLETDEVLSEKIWCSDHTKYKYETVKYWDAKGFRFINDMVNPATGFLLTREEINRRYDIKMTFLCYHTLVTSLPPKIRNGTVLKKLEQPIIPSKLTLMANKVALTRVAYQEYIESNKCRYKKSHQTWMNKWTRDVGKAHEGSMFDLRAETNNTYLLSFHFRIISRIIATNNFLCLMI